MAFFSLPLMIPHLIRTVFTLLSLLPRATIIRTKWLSPVIQHKPSEKTVWKAVICSVVSLTTVLALVHVNTVIHPFTLADNRHYVFYVFRYTILRHWASKYLLTPVYLTCAWFCYVALCRPPTTGIDASHRDETSKTRTREKDLDFSAKTTKGRALKHVARGTTLSWLFVYVLATSLSLVTAPLVEPRYFILPWIFWRLQLPSAPPRSDDQFIDHENTDSGKSATSSNSSVLETAATPAEHSRRWNLAQLSEMICTCLEGSKQHRYALAETAWFLLINYATGYIFLRWTFSWPQEEGKLQRFLW